MDDHKKDNQKGGYIFCHSSHNGGVQRSQLMETIERGSITVLRFENSVFSSNSYILHDGTRAILIDPGDSGPLLTSIENLHLTLVSVLITHTHYDHIYGIRTIMERFPEVPVYTTAFGKRAFFTPNWNFSRYHNDPISLDTPQIKAVINGDRLEPWPGITVEIMETPGHDMSCMSFIICDMLFSGDSYIPDVKVIATFPKSDRRSAEEWYEKLKGMSAQFDVFPGHGPVYYAGHH